MAGFFGRSNRSAENINRQRQYVGKKRKPKYTTVLGNQTNTVAKGQPGSQRAGQQYAVGIGPSGRFYHEYAKTGERAYIGPKNPLYSKYAGLQKQLNLGVERRVTNQKRAQLQEAQGDYNLNSGSARRDAAQQRDLNMQQQLVAKRKLVSQKPKRRKPRASTGQKYL